jgi:hypothetical protein
MVDVSVAQITIMLIELEEIAAIQELALPVKESL